MHILLVEDDKDLGRLIQEELKQRKFEVSWSQNLVSSGELIRQAEFDLAILDLNLPDGTGFELLKPLQCPVIIMSALSDPENRLKGVELGAIEFIPKPFLLQELFLKIDRVLGEKLQKTRVWKKGSICLDLNTREISNSEGTHLLNKRDYRLLDILTTQFPKVVSRNEIMDYVYGTDQNPSQRTVDNTVVGLRQRLEDDGNTWIRSVRGEGYQWLLKGES